MTTSISTTGFPPTYINSYVVEQLKTFGILSGNEQMTPIFPTSPTNIEDVFKNYVGAPGVSDPILIQYERLVRFRTTPFYRNKKDQLVYYLYSTNLTKVMNAQRVINDALDREDSAGQDVNSWISSNKDTFPNSIANVFFHSFRVYQADETRDVLELISARTVYVSKLIIEYDYHTNDISGTLYT